ncbi:MAG TPA: alkaline phosphatase family protein [Anaerovoracaceae bacterium]|nr:alkaline phosphatase family protein [Anaerovoracaceae bacterium]
MSGKILCVIDGATDEKFNINESLKPFLKGYFKTTNKGMETESCNCIMNLLGIIDIPQNSRAWMEAIGDNIELKDNDLVMRTSMVNVDKDMKAISLCHRSCEIDLPRYYNMGSYKGIYITKEECAVDFPVHKHMGERIPNDLGIPQPLKAEGIYLIPWAPSICPKVKEKINGYAVTGISLVKGIAKTLGMKYSDCADFTGDVDTDIMKKIKLTLDKADTEKFVLLHINGTDEAAHRLNPLEKDKFRTTVINIVIENLMGSKHKVIITSDHGTSPITGKHINMKQPYYANFDIELKEDEGVREWLKQ